MEETGEIFDENATADNVKKMPLRPQRKKKNTDYNDNLRHKKSILEI